MKNRIIKKHLFVLVITLLFWGCVFEPPVTYYTFIIQNKTPNRIISRIKTINDDCCSYDTIYPDSCIKIEVMRHHKFIDYKDTLFQTLFSEIEIHNEDNSLSVFPTNKSLWIENLKQLSGGKYIIDYPEYTLNVTNKILKSE